MTQATKVTAPYFSSVLKKRRWGKEKDRHMSPSANKQISRVCCSPPAPAAHNPPSNPRPFLLPRLLRVSSWQGGLIESAVLTDECIGEEFAAYLRSWHQSHTFYCWAVSVPLTAGVRCPVTPHKNREIGLSGFPDGIGWLESNVSSQSRDLNPSERNGLLCFSWEWSFQQPCHFTPVWRSFLCRTLKQIFKHCIEFVSIQKKWMGATVVWLKTSIFLCVSLKKESGTGLKYHKGE